jgi:hypothetical protein
MFWLPEFLLMLARSRETRKSVRRWICRDTQVVCEGRGQLVGCVVHGISSDGVRLSFKGAA